jgi:ABC-type protease/lipase transport system fused ATPase/permease subunit
MIATGILSRWRTAAAMFGIGRHELQALGLDKTHLLRMPWSVVAASAAINLLALALPLTILQVYDRVIPHQSIETLTMLLLGLVVVVAIDAVLRISRAYVIVGGDALHAGRRGHRLRPRHARAGPRLGA